MIKKQSLLVSDFPKIRDEILHLLSINKDVNAQDLIKCSFLTIDQNLISQI